MANIKSMRMWDTIRKDSRIQIKSSWLGLRTTVTFIPTQSSVEARKLEFSPTDGEQLLRILAAKDITQAIGDFHPVQTVNGNYMLEVCYTADGTYLALMLLQYRQMVYEPVTDVRFYEGSEVRTLLTHLGI